MVIECTPHYSIPSKLLLQLFSLKQKQGVEQQKATEQLTLSGEQPYILLLQKN
jgi:hypothetical protein